MSAAAETSLKQRVCDAVEIPLLTRCCFCFPLRKGLITFAYLNLVFSIFGISVLALNISEANQIMASSKTEDMTLIITSNLYKRMIVDASALVLELIMTVLFIVALHMRHVLLMRIYLWFEVVFSTVGVIYSVALLSAETVPELFLILLQLVLQMYLCILIYGSLVKMERDGSVKYTRDSQQA